MKNLFSRIICSLVLLFSMSLSCFSQNLDGYKYLVLPSLEYKKGGSDIWGLREELYNSFKNKGFVVVSTVDNLPEFESRESNSYLFCKIKHNYDYNGLSYTHEIRITLNNSITGNVWIFNESGSGLSSKGAYSKVQKKVLDAIKKINYHFDPNEIPQEQLPEVEQTSWDEQSIRNYLDTSSSLSEIEGIYKSLASTTYNGYYKLGIIKDGNVFKAIVLESNNFRWKNGEVKAILERANMQLYSVKFYMGMKYTVETFATYESKGVLNVDLEKVNKVICSFIKLYPINQSTTPPISTQKPTDSWKASGTGFIISTDGYIATNAHVITGHKRITVEMSKNDKIVRYEATDIIVDAANDIAIIKIEDSSFEPFDKLPYTIETNINIGADVYTIGFPLNDVMGTNHKVTNGIISAKTGIGDDIRKYQITVPIQPGNSGGPLFNKNGNVVGITTSSLNGNAVGAKIENVNYAVKSSYLLNVIKMVPQIKDLPTKSSITGKSMEKQIIILKDYICLIKIY